jgi:hypothetical protein
MVRLGIVSCLGAGLTETRLSPAISAIDDGLPPKIVLTLVNIWLNTVRNQVRRRVSRYFSKVWWDLTDFGVDYIVSQRDKRYIPGSQRGVRCD